jgi:RHS repeat-associated protein
VEEIAYYPFGEPWSDSSEIYLNHKYTGQERDRETGLYNYGARLYDPEIGRFTTPDTIVPDYTNPQSLNRFAYVLNNPLKYTDPTGHEEEGDGGFWDGFWEWLTSSGGGSTAENSSWSNTYDPGITAYSFGLPFVNPYSSFSDYFLLAQPLLNGPYVKRIADNDSSAEPVGYGRANSGLVVASDGTVVSNPDYVSLSIAIGPVGGAQLGLTLSREGDVFWQHGVEIGKSPTLVSGSLVVGYLERAATVSLREFLTGSSNNISAGVLTGGGATWASGYQAIERGLYWPQLGVSGTYGHYLGTLPIVSW